ncbi:hypothetical protein NC652_020412 [Populus alba x Populus x berolinensis]|nr:hypothetical protein NC652_020412 [Populus alba x Populus x berolinensis]
MFLRNLIQIAYSNKINELCSQGRYKDATKCFHESAQKDIVVPKSTCIILMDGLFRRVKVLFNYKPIEPANLRYETTSGHGFRKGETFLQVGA